MDLHALREPIAGGLVVRASRSQEYVAGRSGHGLVAFDGAPDHVLGLRDSVVLGAGGERRELPTSPGGRGAERTNAFCHEIDGGAEIALLASGIA